MGVLESVDGANRAVLLPEMTVGRSPKSDLRLADGDVSTNHAVFTWTGEHWQIRDAGSKNGTMVDGRVLKNGDSAILESGSAVVFSSDQAWRLADASGPAYPLAIPLAGGPPIEAVDGVLSLPPDGSEEVVITRKGATFTTFTNGIVNPIEPGEIVVADGRSYRILLPPG